MAQSDLFGIEKVGAFTYNEQLKKLVGTTENPSAHCRFACYGNGDLYGGLGMQA